MYKILLSGLVLLSSALALASGERLYLSSMDDSRWTLSVDSPTLCQIEHDIPLFGKAVFYRESGRELRLKLMSQHDFKKGLKVAMYSATAHWRPQQTQAVLAKTETLGGNSPVIALVDDTARHAYFELQQGYQPSLYFIDEQDGFNPVSVILSTVRFRDVEADFGRCIERLYPVHFDDVQASSVYFDFDQEFPLDGEEQRAIDPMVAYLQVDPLVKKVVISGHTDLKGSRCYNEKLSARRARYVYDYLELSGVDPAKLEIRTFGESRPLVNQRSGSTTALNRRVSIEMVR
jgi:outer membrane protein OmpA-like peptidoglycan-associated protein